MADKISCTSTSEDSPYCALDHCYSQAVVIGKCTFQGDDFFSRNFAQRKKIKTSFILVWNNLPQDMSLKNVLVSLFCKRSHMKATTVCVMILMEWSLLNCNCFPIFTVTKKSRYIYVVAVSGLYQLFQLVHLISALFFWKKKTKKLWGLYCSSTFLLDRNIKELKGRYTIGNCQRPVFSLGVSQHCIK